MYLKTKCNFSRRNPFLMSDLKKPGNHIHRGCDFPISFESSKSDVFNCTSIEIISASVPFNLGFSLSSVRDRKIEEANSFISVIELLMHNAVVKWKAPHSDCMRVLLFKLPPTLLRTERMTVRGVE